MHGDIRPDYLYFDEKLENFVIIDRFFKEIDE